jgi:hypothetical protein
LVLEFPVLFLEVGHFDFLCANVLDEVGGFVLLEEE